jgi:tetratricopeptide (TPR) repeat protein
MATASGRALPLLERAVDICQDADLPGFFPRMALALGAAYTLAERVADAVPLLTQAMAQAMTTDRGGYQTLCRLLLGEAQLLAGRLEEARTELSAAIELYRAMEMTFWLNRAEIALVQGRERGT